MLFAYFHLELLGLVWVPGGRVRRASRGLSAAEFLERLVCHGPRPERK